MFDKHDMDSASNRSSTELQGGNPFSPQQIEEGVYTASSYSDDGEKIYLRMERITEENDSAWRQYRDSAGRLTTTYRGVLVVLPLFIEKDEGSDHYSIDLRAAPVDSVFAHPTLPWRVASLWPRSDNKDLPKPNY